MTETIVAAAIRLPVADDLRQIVWQGVRHYPDYLIISALPPARHPSLMNPLHDKHGIIPSADQGFVTSTGRYVEREEALQIAIGSGQPMIDHPSRHHRWLFSEDLW